MIEGLLEVAAGSVASALAAQAGGASRVELCSALELGGLTPSHAAIAAARAQLEIPLYVLVRPRPGDFVYDAAECEIMLDDIAHCRALGCDGVVLGVLDADGGVDVARCRVLVEAASGMGVTFHRAFDVAADPSQALEDIIALGCERVLTSGGKADALVGAAEIRERVQQARGRIAVMAGAGITPDNIAAIAAATGAPEFHASARARPPARSRHPPPALPGLDTGDWQTEAATVRACVDNLQAGIR